VASLLRRLGTLDLALITIGAVIGSGIFRTPSVVAQRAHVPALILACWALGGVVAVIGAFVFAELAARRPLSGGLYAYLRDAYNPGVAFVFGWTLLFIGDTGGTAASAVLFAGYFEPLTGLHVAPTIVAVVTLALVTAINVLGVRQGGTWQNVLVVLKIGAIGGLIAAGIFAHPSAASAAPIAFHSGGTLLGALGVAMLPVLFSYNGFQGASFITGETRDPERTIPRGLIIGVGTIVVIYLLANIGYLRALGAAGLAHTHTPASDVMQAAIGPVGARVIAVAITLSTLGFMSTRLLVAPRIYHQMAQDGLFFKAVGWINPRTHVPTVAIMLEGLVAAIIAASGTFEQIVNWVVAPEWAFVVMAAGAVFVFRRRDAGKPPPTARVPGHPWTTGLFILTLLAIFAAELLTYPRDTLYGALVMGAGVVFFVIWRRARAVR